MEIVAAEIDEVVKGAAQAGGRTYQTVGGNTQSAVAGHLEHRGKVLEVIPDQEIALTGTMLAGIETGEHGGMGRHGPASRGIAAGVDPALRSQANHLGRGGPGIAVKGQMPGAGGVQDDEDNMGRARKSHEVPSLRGV